MRYFIYSFSITVAILLISASCGVSTAIAGTITQGSLSPAAETAAEQKVLLWSDPGYTADAYSGLFQAADAGGVEAGIGLGSTALVVVGGSYVVYKIADGLGLGNFVYRTITGSDPDSATTGSIIGVEWHWCGVGGIHLCTSYAGYTDAGWVAQAQCTSGCQGSSGTRQERWCAGGSPFSGPNAQNLNGIGINQVTGATGYCASGTDAVSVSGGTTEPQTLGNMAGNPYGFSVTPATATQYNAAPAAQRVVAPGANGTTCNSTCLAAALAAINASNAAAQSAKQAAAVAALINAILAADPATGGTTQTVLLLQPRPNETYDYYATRLRAEGYLGTITDVAEPAALSNYGPNAVTRVSYTDGVGKVQTLDPLAWPTTLPVLAPNAALTVRHNPSTATPGPTVTPGTSPSAVCGTVALGACQVQDTSTGPDNAVDTIDWTPIESINFGSKFPFGIPAYVNSFFAAVPTGSSCPTLSIGKPSALGGGTINIPFCNSEWESTYRSPIFLVLEALMTLAGVTWLAQKITGSGSDD